MFIHPVRPVVRPINRPMGAPLLRGMLLGGVPRGGYGTRRERDAAASDPPSRPHAQPPVQTPELDQQLARTQRDLQLARAELARTQAAQVSAVTASGTPQGEPTAGGDVADRLALLGQMARQGLLTPDEFTAAKARLLEA